LHSGFRAEELCKLKSPRVKLGKRSGHLKAYGKRGKYREVPINVTVRAALAERIEELPRGVSSSWLWPYIRARKPVTARGLRSSR
jgi:integrase/recombinase XerD